MYTLRGSRRPKSGDLRCRVARAFARCVALFFGAGRGHQKVANKKAEENAPEAAQRGKRQQQDRHKGQHQTQREWSRKSSTIMPQMAPKVVEMGPKRCRNALPGGLQKALEGSWRPLGLQVASGGALRGGLGRLQGQPRAPWDPLGAHLAGNVVSRGLRRRTI